MAQGKVIREERRAAVSKDMQNVERKKCGRKKSEMLKPAKKDVGRKREEAERWEFPPSEKPERQRVEDG